MKVVAAALLDRLLHLCHLVNIRQQVSDADAHGLSKAIHPTASRATDAERAQKGACREPWVPFSMSESVPFSLPTDNATQRAVLPTPCLATEYRDCHPRCRESLPGR